MLTGRSTGDFSGQQNQLLFLVPIRVYEKLEFQGVFISRRYKMISQFTWPNFHGGDAEEGTRVLLEDRKFLKDVTFGKTKIFVRSPSTLFELEKARYTMPFDSRCLL